MSKESFGSAQRQGLDADAMVPAHLIRQYPFPERRGVALNFLGEMTRYPTLWGLLGAGVYIGYAYVGGGADRLEAGDLSQALPMLIKGVAYSFGPVFASIAVNEGLESLTAALYREDEGFIQHQGPIIDGKPTLEQRARSKSLDTLGQWQHLLSRKEKAYKSFLSAAEVNPYNLSSRISLVEMAAERYRKGEETFEGVVERCYWAARSVIDMTPAERKLQRAARPTVMSSLRSKWWARTIADARDIIPRMALLAVNHASGRHRPVIETVDDIVRESRKEGLKDFVEGKEAESAETAGLYGYLATLMRSVSIESKRYAGKARGRERWLWEQVYLMAAGGEVSYLGESKNKVMMIGTPAIRQEIIVKEYPDKRQAEGEIALTERISGVITGREEYLVPEPIASFGVTHQKEKKEVTIWRLLPGETFYEKIRHGDPDIKETKDRALALLGLIHKEILPEEFGLSERDYASYIKDWAERAEVVDVFRNGELRGHYLPILESFSMARKVISLDPHAMNFFVISDGRVAKIDNELTRSIPVQGDLVRFLELFPYDTTRKEWPGTPDHKGFMEDLSAYEAGYGTLTKDDSFYLGYLNAVVDLSLSLYSPYSVRMEMGHLKKDLLFKCRNTLDIIGTDFHAFHERYKEQYKGLRRVCQRMIERNGFG